jgi:hypothetical protein
MHVNVLSTVHQGDKVTRNEDGDSRAHTTSTTATRRKSRTVSTYLCAHKATAATQK